MKQIIPILFAILLFSCKDSSVNNNNAPGIIFEVETENYAWGIVYQGVMIDADGNEYSYNPGKDSISYLYHSDGYYTYQELKSKYEHFKTYIKKVPSDSLSWSHNLSTKVTTTDYSDTSREGADMGSSYFSVYIDRLGSGKYQKIILKVEGDWAYYNKSENAIALAGWLKRLMSQGMIR